MRRFEREIDGRMRFWEVDLRGTELTISSGFIGRAPKVRTQSHRSPDAAARTLAEAVQTMLVAGWVEVERDAPEAHIDEPMAGVHAQPDDPVRYLVLGDQLQAQGDPRGELIAVQVAIAMGDERDELHSREKELLALHQEAWLGPLAQLEHPWEVEWYCGFLRKLSLRAQGYGTLAAGALEALVGTGSIALLRSLEIRGGEQLDAVVHGLGRRSWPHLERLVLGGADGAAKSSARASDLLRTLPALTELELAISPAEMGHFQHPRLSRLALRVADGRSLRGLDLGGLEALSELAIHIHAPDSTESLAAVIGVPLQRLQLGGADAAVGIDSLVGRRAALGKLVIGPTPAAPRVVAALRRVASALEGVDIELVGVDLSDSDLADLSGLRIDTDLPDVAVRSDRVQVSPRQESLRRFERTGRSRRFWQIVRVGSMLRVGYGAVGSAGTVREQRFPTEEKAAAEYRRRVRKKRAAGWEEVSSIE